MVPEVRKSFNTNANRFTFSRVLLYNGGMGITERRAREKNERRRAILDCVRELILLRGVERVNMEDIAQKTELSKATLYLYFPGKEAIFNEICEESARGFLEHLREPLREGLSGMRALRFLWRGYAKLFGNGDEMIVIFQVRNFLHTWLPSGPEKGEIRSPDVGAIVKIMYDMIEQCKAEGIFDPNLNPADAVRLIFSMFSTIIGNVARLPPESRNPTAMLDEMTGAFQIIIRGLGREGVEHSRLDISLDA